jgi:hypothetical protein
MEEHSSEDSKNNLGLQLADRHRHQDASRSPSLSLFAQNRKMEPGCEVCFGAVLKSTRPTRRFKFANSTLHSFRYEKFPRCRNGFAESFREKVVDAPADD